MKKFIVTYILLPIGLFFIFNILVFAIAEIGGEAEIRKGVITNIGIAREKYSGNAEDALITYLLDTTNTFNDRSHIAVWTLGQIKSKKALPIILQLYKDDPTGLTCKGRHDSVICQKVLFKAILAIKSEKQLQSEFNK
ncbi:MAG: HEAT repeat domain-containing protein [Methanococcaceae archaeon]